MSEKKTGEYQKLLRRILQSSTAIRTIVKNESSLKAISRHLKNDEPFKSSQMNFVDGKKVVIALIEKQIDFINERTAEIRSVLNKMKDK